MKVIASGVRLRLPRTRAESFANSHIFLFSALLDPPIVLCMPLQDLAQLLLGYTSQLGFLALTRFQYGGGA